MSIRWSQAVKVPLSGSQDQLSELQVPRKMRMWAPWWKVLRISSLWQQNIKPSGGSFWDTRKPALVEFCLWLCVCLLPLPCLSFSSCKTKRLVCEVPLGSQLYGAVGGVSLGSPVGFGSRVTSSGKSALILPRLARVPRSPMAPLLCSTRHPGNVCLPNNSCLSPATFLRWYISYMIMAQKLKIIMCMLKWADWPLIRGY